MTGSSLMLPGPTFRPAAADLLGSAGRCAQAIRPPARARPGGTDRHDRIDQPKKALPIPSWHPANLASRSSRASPPGLCRKARPGPRPIAQPLSAAASREVVVHHLWHLKALHACDGGPAFARRCARVCAAGGPDPGSATGAAGALRASLIRPASGATLHRPTGRRTSSEAGAESSDFRAWSARPVGGRGRLPGVRSQGL